MEKMNGTEKQVKWATDIIETAFRYFDRNIERMEKAGENDEDVKAAYKLTLSAFRHVKEEFEKVVNLKRDAKFWIDNREHFSQEATSRLISAQRDKLLKNR